MVENVSEDAPAVASPLSSLSAMMIECTRVALLEKDYVNALENILTVASVDDRPEVTVALAATVLDIAGALGLARGAVNAKAQLLSLLPQPDSGQRIRQWLDHDTLMHILEVARGRTGWFRAWKRRDKVAGRLLKDIDRAARGDRAEDSPNLQEIVSRRLRSAPMPAGLPSIFRWLSWVIAPARSVFSWIERGVFYIATGLLLAAGSILLLAAIPAIAALGKVYPENIPLKGPPISSADCPDIFSASQYLLDFFQSDRGLLSVSLLLVLRALAHYTKRFRSKEARELAAALMVSLVFSVCWLVLDSSKIAYFAEATAKIVKAGCPLPTSPLASSHSIAWRG
jgi:hypothetical protein